MAGIEVLVLSLSGTQLASIGAEESSTLADLFDKLLEANECRICTLVYNEFELCGPSNLFEYGFRLGKNVVTAIFKTKQWLEESGFSPTMLMNTDSDSMAHRASNKLKSCGYTVRELRATGYTASELRTCLEAMRNVPKREAQIMDMQLHPTCPACLLRDGGYSFAEMHEAGYSTRTLKDLGFSLAIFIEANIAISDMMEAGFTALDFLQNGWTLSDLQKLAFRAGQLKCTRTIPKQLKEAGYTVEQLKMAGYSLVQMKEGFSLPELKQAGYTAWVLAKSGFGVKELEEAGFTSTELGNAGFVIPDSTHRRHSAPLIRAARLVLA